MPSPFLREMLKDELHKIREKNKRVIHGIPDTGSNTEKE